MQSQDTSSHPRSDRHCKCRASYKYKRYGHSTSFGRGENDKPAPWIASTFTSTLIHRTDCPLCWGSQEVRRFGLKISAPRWLLRRTIEAAMSITRGSGGFSISPMLAFNNIVPSNTGPFKILDLDPLNSHSCCTATLETVLRHDRQQLSRLYREGKASPRDIDEHGNTVLHVRLTLQQSFLIHFGLTV